MLQDLNERLSRMVEEKRKYAKLRRDLDAVEARLADTTGVQKTLRQRLEKEKVDVEKLENASLKSIFFSVLGSRSEQLDKERQEMLAAQLKYDQVSHQVRQLEEEREYLARQIERLQYDEAGYQNLLAEKEEFIRNSGQPAAAELLSLAQEIGSRKVEIFEIGEAVTAGKAALKSLAKAIEALKSAKGWGTWDILGGGLIATMAKHTRIDDARTYIYAVQDQLERFQRELADVDQTVVQQIEIGGFEYFADYFFDGLIADWLVQSRVVDSLARCDRVYGHVGAAVRKLEMRCDQALSEVAELEAKKTGLIEQT